jgi:predicted RNase H-like nuclease
MARVIGVDACPKGWIGVTNDIPPRGHFAATVADLTEAADRDGLLDVIAVDIPIGLPVSGLRQADLLARAAVGRLASSVFPTPVRDALTAPTHAEAVAASTRLTGKGISVQSYGLRHRILEVEEFVRGSGRAVIEVHPEVSFATMAGRPLDTRKSTWAGLEERRTLLERAGIIVPADLGAAGRAAGPDDVLDAAAAMWSAVRFLNGSAVGHPAEPESLGDGPPACIWA